jgi:hypothetical protein
MLQMKRGFFLVAREERQKYSKNLYSDYKGTFFYLAKYLFLLAS